MLLVIRVSCLWSRSVSEPVPLMEQARRLRHHFGERSGNNEQQTVVRYLESVKLNIHHSLEFFYVLLHSKTSKKCSMLCQ